MVLLPIIALAYPGEELATVALPNLTRETLVGTWEAVIPTEITGITRGLYHLEVAKGPNAYLIGVEFELEKMSVELVAQSSDFEVLLRRRHTSLQDCPAR